MFTESELRKVLRDIFVLMIIVTFALFLYHQTNPYYLAGALDRMIWADIAVGLIAFAFYAENIRPPAFRRKKKKKLFRRENFQPRIIRFASLRYLFNFQRNPKIIINIIFQVLLVLFLILLLAREVFSFEFFNINALLGLVVLFGVITAIKPPETDKKQNSPLEKKDYIFILILGVVGGLIIWYKTQNIGWLGYIVSAIAAVLIILLSILVLEEDEQ